MKIAFILFSVALSATRFGKLRREGFYHHHLARNSSRRPNRSSPPKNLSTDLLVTMNKSKQEVLQHIVHNGAFYNVAGPKFINDMLGDMKINHGTYYG